MQAFRQQYTVDLVRSALSYAIDSGGIGRCCPLVAEQDRRVVGCVMLIRLGSHFHPDGLYVPPIHEDVAAVEDLVVHPDFRSRGIGTALVSTALDVARDVWKSRQVRAFTMNPHAARIFESLGMTFWGELPSAREPGELERHFFLTLR